MVVKLLEAPDLSLFGGCSRLCRQVVLAEEERRQREYGAWFLQEPVGDEWETFAMCLQCSVSPSPRHRGKYEQCQGCGSRMKVTFTQTYGHGPYERGALEYCFACSVKRGVCSACGDYGWHGPGQCGEEKCTDVIALICPKNDLGRLRKLRNRFWRRDFWQPAHFPPRESTYVAPLRKDEAGRRKRRLRKWILHGPSVLIRIVLHGSGRMISSGICLHTTRSHSRC